MKLLHIVSPIVLLATASIGMVNGDEVTADINDNRHGISGGVIGDNELNGNLLYKKQEPIRNLRPSKGTKAPSTKSTKAPSTKSTKAPSTKSTKAPSTKSTKAPSTKSTKAPSTKSTKAPNTKSTKAPSTKSAKVRARNVQQEPVRSGAFTW